MILTSLAFQEGHPIPRAHTADGLDVTPTLSWSGVPETAKSLALIVEDPDAPDPLAPNPDPWVHWVLYGVNPSTDGFRSGGGLEGLNSWNELGWRGPNPPKGRHRYFFRLYALDVLAKELHLFEPTRDMLLRALEGHIFDTATLMGTYQRDEDPNSPKARLDRLHDAMGLLPFGKGF